MPQHQPRSNRAARSKPPLKPRQLKLELLESRSVLSVSMPGGDWHFDGGHFDDGRDFGPHRESGLFMSDRSKGMDAGGRGDFGREGLSSFGYDSPGMRDSLRPAPGFGGGPRDGGNSAPTYQFIIVTTSPASSVRAPEITSSLPTTPRAGSTTSSSVVSPPTGPLTSSQSQLGGSQAQSEESFTSIVDSIWRDSASAVGDLVAGGSIRDTSPAGSSQSQANSLASDLALGSLTADGQALGRIAATLTPLLSPLSKATLGLSAAAIDALMSSTIASDDWTDAALESRSETRSLTGMTDAASDGGFVDLQLSLDDNNANETAVREAQRADAARAAKSRLADAAWWAGKKRTADHNSSSPESGLSSLRHRAKMAISPWKESPTADTSASESEGGEIELVAVSSDAPVARATVRPQHIVRGQSESRLSGVAGLFRAFELASEPEQAPSDAENAAEAEREVEEAPVLRRATEQKETPELTLHRAAASALVAASALATIVKEEE